MEQKDLGRHYCESVTFLVVHGASPFIGGAVLAAFLLVMAVMEHRAGAGRLVVGHPQAVVVALGQAEHSALVYGVGVAGALDGA